MSENKIQKKEKNSLQLSDSLVSMYKENANLGTDNLQGELPILKVHSAGRSQNNELASGEEPADGNFYYKPEREQFKELTVHILSISKGFKTKGFEDKIVFNQIASGVIMEGDSFKPFSMFFSGLKLEFLWNFGKEASTYTKAKPVPIPMFALTVKLTTSKVSHKYGKAWVVNFEILKDESGNPIVVTDEGLFVFLKDSIPSVEQRINSLIDGKELFGVEDITDSQVQAAKDTFDIPDDI